MRNPIRRTITCAARQEGRAAVALMALACCALAFAFLAEAVGKGTSFGFDSSIVLALRTSGSPAMLLGPPWLQELARDVTALGSVPFLTFLALSVSGYLWLIRERMSAGLIAVSFAGSVVVSTLLKLGFDRPRPELPDGARVFTASFPSGHTTLSAVTFLILGALLARLTPHKTGKVYVMGVAVFLVAAVGLSRLYLGLHYPTDVAAGWCVGGAWTLLCWMTWTRLPRSGADSEAAAIPSGD